MQKSYEKIATKNCPMNNQVIYPFFLFQTNLLFFQNLYEFKNNFLRVWKVFW